MKTKRKKQTKDPFVNALSFITTAITTITIFFIVVVFTSDMEGDKLAFTGAIIGGAFTLYGVVLTMIFGKATQNQELLLQYKPILALSNNHSYHLNRYEVKAPKIDFKNTTIYYYLYLKNVGRGEAQNVCFSLEVNKNLFDIKLNTPSTNQLNTIEPTNNDIPIILCLTPKCYKNELRSFLQKNNPQIKLSISYSYPFDEEIELKEFILKHHYEYKFLKPINEILIESY